MVGTAICRELARRRLSPVLSLGRSDGPGAGGPLPEGVTQHSGVDALKPETYGQFMKGARAVVITIGEAPWTEIFRKDGKERAMLMNGTTNIKILQAAAQEKVPRVVLLSATMPRWGLISGYRQGKEAAAAEAAQCASVGGADSGILVLQPSAVSGTRYAGNVPIPLWLMLAPMRMVFSSVAAPCRWLEGALPSLFAGVLRPAVSAEEIAAAAADAIEDPTFSGLREVGTDELVGYRSHTA